MPITSSAKKALRQSKRKRTANVRYTNRMRLITKEFKKLLSEKKLTEAQALLPKLYAAYDKAAQHNIIKKNTAARKKSRMTVALAKRAS
ncbi:MAG: 30S ribosomal protein S20 [Patescibacteria group bacterium]